MVDDANKVLSGPSSAPANSKAPLLRLVILDYPKMLLEQDPVKKALADMLSSRQISFHRTINSYILMDKLDMISTHVLVYDVTDIYAPKIISGIRVVHSDRSKEFGLKLPLDENILHATLPVQRKYQEFRSQRSDLSECTGWFVDTNFSYAKTKLDLAEILFFGVTTFLLRKGVPYFSGATNEKYKGSRWVAKVGPYEDGLTYMHPTIPCEHKLTLLTHFHPSWLKSCFLRYRDLVDNRYELSPESGQFESMESLRERVLSATEGEIIKAA